MTNPRDSPAAAGSVAIVIVNWNGYEETSTCLESLHEIDYQEYCVIVVDNGSTDGSGDRLAAEFDWCEFVFNETNEGFGGGCNAGIDAALSRGMDYVLLLNPDARIGDTTLSELVAVQRESSAAVVGATITHDDGTVINSTPSHYPDMLFYSGYRRNLPVGSESGDQYANERWFSTDRVEGAGVLITSELLQEREETVECFLDDSLFMYCEEVELAMWCHERDERSVIAVDAVVEHDSEASSSRPFQLYYLTRNRVLIAHRYLQDGERLAFDLLYLVTRLALAGRWLIRGEKAIATAIFDGLVDGYRHVEGRTS